MSFTPHLELITSRSEVRGDVSRQLARLVQELAELTEANDTHRANNAEATHK